MRTLRYASRNEILNLVCRGWEKVTLICFRRMPNLTTKVKSKEEGQKIVIINLKIVQTHCETSETLWTQCRVYQTCLSSPGLSLWGVGRAFGLPTGSVHVAHIGCDGTIALDRLS